MPSELSCRPETGKSRAIKHGASAGYYRACLRENGEACEPCKAANARYASRYKSKVRAERAAARADADATRVPEHGTSAEHTLYKCSCEYCLAAHRVHVRILGAKSADGRTFNENLLARVREAALTDAPIPPRAEKQSRGSRREETDWTFLEGVAPGDRWQARIDHFSNLWGTRAPKAGDAS